MFTLKGKIILVTGAGSGIGQETAITLSGLDASVIICDIDSESLDNTKKLIGKCDAYQIDLSDFGAIAEMTDKISQQYGALDGIVHCAGISSRKPLKVLKPEGFSKVMNINFYAFEELLRNFMKRNRFNDGGSIVVMSSISAIRGYKAKAEYCVSKAGVDAFVRCMAAELAPRKIRVNSVMAAEVNTPLALKAKELNQNIGASEFNAPLGASEPYEIANTIAFLLSDATKTITGTALLIDGGATIV